MRRVNPGVVSRSVAVVAGLLMHVFSVQPDRGSWTRSGCALTDALELAGHFGCRSGRCGPQVRGPGVNTYLLMAGQLAIGSETNRETRTIAGWTVHIRQELLTNDARVTARALELLRAQLEEIARVVPGPALAELRKVPLWISPQYPGESPRAEYHPGAGWLREHGRDPVMVKGVEFTNVRIFEAETRRMPNFALHELAHAYHDRVLPSGFDHPGIRTAYDRAKAAGRYDRVERWFGNGKPNTFERAYAMTTPQEYFAETTEAFFSRNDFFPFTRDELKRHDPEMADLLERLWRGPKSNGDGGSSP